MAIVTKSQNVFFNPINLQRFLFLFKFCNKFPYFLIINCRGAALLWYPSHFAQTLQAKAWTIANLSPSRTALDPPGTLEGERLIRGWYETISSLPSLEACHQEFVIASRVQWDVGLSVPSPQNRAAEYKSSWGNLELLLGTIRIEVICFLLFWCHLSVYRTRTMGSGAFCYPFFCCLYK